MMSEAHERIVPLGEKLMAVLAEHDAGDPETTLSDQLAAVSMAGGRTLGNFLPPGDENRAIIGAMMFRDQVLGHIVTRWEERVGEKG
jgi:hypothetical protein